MIDRTLRQTHSAPLSLVIIMFLLRCCLQFLDAKVAGQLILADLKKRKTGLGDAQIPQNLPRHQTDPGLGRLLPERLSRIEQRDDVCLADNNLVQRDSKKKFQRSGLARTARLIIDPNMILRELLGQAKKALERLSEL